MESVVLKAQRRDPAGRRAAGRVRRQGLVPGIIYGHGEVPVPIMLGRDQLTGHLHSGAHLVDLDLDGQSTKLLVKDVQYNHLGDTVIHVDLARVNLDEKVEVTVPLRFRGEPIGVKEGEGQLLTPITEVEVECLVTAIPNEIRVNIAHLKVGDMLTVEQIETPEGVRILDHADLVVAQVNEPMAEEAAAAAEGEGPAEPEVIGRAAEAAEGDEAAEPKDKPAKDKGEKKGD